MVFWRQVRGAISALKYYRGLPKLPSEFYVPSTRSADVLDFLRFVFGFQVCNIVVIVCMSFTCVHEDCPTFNNVFLFSRDPRMKSTYLSEGHFHPIISVVLKTGWFMMKDLVIKTMDRTSQSLHLKNKVERYD